MIGQLKNALTKGKAGTNDDENQIEKQLLGQATPKK